MKAPVETIEQAWAALLELTDKEPEAWLLYPIGGVLNWVTIEFFDRAEYRGQLERGTGTWKVTGTLIGIVEGAIGHYSDVVERRRQSIEK